MEENNVIICENCYEENESTRATCKACGARLYKNNNEMGIKEDSTRKKQSVKTNNVVRESRTANCNNSKNSNDNYTYSYKTNSMASILSIIGALEIISGFILGIVLGNTFETGYYYKEFNTALCVTTIVVGIITGIFILGFAEIIQKLQNIEDNTRK